MKTRTKLLSMLLLVAMCMSFMAIPAYAVGEDNVVGRVTADMMFAEPETDDFVVTVDAAADEAPAAVPAPVQSANTPAVAVIKRANGDESYGSFEAALSAAAAGDVIQLKSNLNYSSTLNINKSVTILLNGYTISVKVSAVNPGISASGVTLRGGSVVISGAAVQVKEGETPPTYSAGITGSLTLDDVNVTYSGPDRMIRGSVTVFGGSFSSDPTAYLPDGYEAVLVNDRYVVREAVEEPAEEATEEPAEEATEEPAEEVTEEPAEEATEEPAEEVTEEPAEEVTEEPAEEATEEPAEEATEEPAEEATEEPAEEATEEPAEEVTEEPAEEVTEEPAEEVTEEPAEEVTEEPAEEVTEEPAEEATEEPAEEATEEPAEEVTEEPAEEVTEETAEEPKNESLIDQIIGLFSEEDEDVDEEAKNIPHSTEMVASDGGTHVTIDPAPEDASLTVSAASDFEAAVMAAVEDEEAVDIVWAKDIDVGTVLEEALTVTIQDEVFKTLPEGAVLYHVNESGVAEPVAFALDRDSGTITFSSKSFSPYVLTAPDVMNPSTKNDDADLQTVLSPDIHIKDGDIQAAVNKTTSDKLIVVLDNYATWNLTNWGSVKNLEIQLGNYAIGAAITVPSGKSLTITGSAEKNTIGNNITVNGGDLILTGTGKVLGGITLNSGNLYIDGSKFGVAGTIAAKGSSFVEINSGTYGAITADSSAGGHITGGTYSNAVPTNILATGYSSKLSDKVYIVYMSVEARVKTINGSINFTRDGGNYVEFYKGTANASQNYSFQFAVAPVDGLNKIKIYDPADNELLDLTGLYTYDAGNGRVVISKSTVSDKLNALKAGRVYIRFFFTSGAEIDVPLNIYPNVTFDPTTYIIDSFKPVVFTLSSAADVPAYITVDLKDGENPYNKLLSTSNYTISGDKITLNTSYLNNLAPGAHNFDFWYDVGLGKMVRLRCTVTVSADYKVIEINNVNLYKDKSAADVNWYQYSGKNLNFTANGHPSKFVGVKVDGKLINAGNYAVYKDTTNGTTTVGLYPGYLATLAQGKHTVAVVFTDGEATAEFNILSASASPKTGDSNNIWLWVGVLTLSGAAVVALIPKKKKQ